MKIVFLLAVALLAIVSVSGYCAECDEDNWRLEENECSCCPYPCCCKCMEMECPPLTTSLKCGCIDLNFMVDSSGSIGPLAWSISNQFLVDIVTALENHNPDCDHEISVAPITFGTNATLHWNFDDIINEDFDTIVESLKALEQNRGQTNLVEAMELAISDVYNGDRSECSNVAIIITDGKATYELDRIQEVADELNALLDQIFCIGITNQIDEQELLQICPVVLDVNDFQQLNSTTLEFLVTMLPSPEPCVPKNECFCCCPPARYY